MKVVVKLFAAHRQLAGQREVLLEAPTGATVLEVWRKLKNDVPKLAHLSDTLIVAVNLAYVPLDTVVHEGDVVAFIPPVSGGCGSMGCLPL